MHPAIQSIKTALGYATFANSDVEKATNDALETIGTELKDEFYETGDEVDAALQKLTEAMNDADAEEDAADEQDEDDEDNFEEDEDKED